MTDPYEMNEILGHQVELVIDGGYCGPDPTTVIDMVDGSMDVVRKGRGSDEALF